MNDPFWQRFPMTPGLHCVAMKDRAQHRIMEQTRDSTPEAIVKYYRNASHRFWQEVGRAYPVSDVAPMAVREGDEPSSKG